MPIQYFEPAKTVPFVYPKAVGCVYGGRAILCSKHWPTPGDGSEDVEPIYASDVQATDICESCGEWIGGVP